MSNQAMQQKTPTPQAQLNQYLTQHKAQLAAALPKHLNPDRMARLALTAFSQNKALQQCDPKSVFSSLIVLSQLGLEPGIDGQGYLVPYGKICTPIPGWKGYVDLVSRSGRGTIYSGVIFRDQKYTFTDGARRDLVIHNETDLDDPEDITHAYAIGWVKDAAMPIIELWRTSKVIKHRDKYNKVGQKHYSFGNFEMYARKVVLLQVIKYMPKSIELQAAMEIDLAATEGKGTEYINGEFVTMDTDEQAGPALAEVATTSTKPPKPETLEEKALRLAKEQDSIPGL